MTLTIATRGPKIGQCNICGDVGKLTEDHTPPKGCYKPRQVELQSLLSRLSGSPVGHKSRFSQNGVKYRTLCHRCNNSLLGGSYDPPFIDFVNQVAGLLNTSLILPNELAVRAQPQAIARSLLGHISAQGVDRYRKGPLTEAVRDYFVDTNLPLPSDLSIFYWVYPFRSHVMARDVAYLDLKIGEPVAIWFLKFFPMAFMIAWDKTGPMPYPVQRLCPWRDVPYETQAELPIRLKPLPHEHWPEAPTEHSVLVYGREAINVRANPSIERTSPGKPGAASHVKR